MADSRSEIEQLNEQDAYNFKHVREHLGYNANLPDDVAKAYDFLAKANSPARLPTLQARTANALFFLCRKHLTLGAIALFRIYSAQMFRETRAAVEAAGIAHAIQTNLDDFNLFRDDGSPEARRRVRKTFTSARLFPTEVPELAELRRYYNTASDLSHTNRMTFIRHLSAGKGPNEATFYYQDIRPDEGKQLPSFLHWLCAAHVRILFVADVVFPDNSVALEDFRKERRYVAEKLGRFHLQHKSRLTEGPGAP